MTGRQRGGLRAFGVAWLLLAPTLVVMAGISTVRSDVAYRVQLAAFSLVALGGAFFGVAGILRLRWAATGLWVLSWFGALYFLGSAFLIVVWPLVPGSTAEFAPLILGVSIGVAVTGLPFVMMARALGRIISNQRRVAADGGDVKAV
jgi:hypothetical protein